MSIFHPISISVSILADLPKVWACFTEPEHITRWYQAADTWHAPYAENNLSVDGTFKTTMSAKDGSASFDFEGKYTSVILFKHIAYILADGRKVDISFSEKDNSVILTETFDAENENSHELQKSGWQAILDSLKKYIETQ